MRFFFFFDFYFLLTILKLDLTNFIFLLQNKNVFQSLSSTVCKTTENMCFLIFHTLESFYWIYFYMNTLLVIRATPANSVHIVTASCISGCQSWTISQPPDCLPQAGSHFPLLLPGLREEGKQVLQSTGLPKALQLLSKGQTSPKVKGVSMTVNVTNQTVTVNLWFRRELLGFSVIHRGPDDGSYSISLGNLCSLSLPENNWEFIHPPKGHTSTPSLFVGDKHRYKLITHITKYECHRNI